MSKSLVKLLLLLILPVLIITSASAAASAAAAAEGGGYQAWIEENAKQPNIKTSSNGQYQYQILQKGHGVDHVASSQERFRCHYEGRLTDGTVLETTYASDGTGTGDAHVFNPMDIDDEDNDEQQHDTHHSLFAAPFLLNMVEGDIYELYLPLELTNFGNKDGDTKTSSTSNDNNASVAIYKLKLVEIVGKRVSALTCSVTEPDKDCNPNETKYVTKVMAKTKDELSRELTRQSLILKTNNEEDSLFLEPMKENWTHRRIHILQQAIMEKEKEVSTCNVEHPAETCNAKEIHYIKQASTRLDSVLSKHLEVFTGRLLGGQQEPDVDDWTRRQIHILNQIITGDEEEFFKFSHIWKHDQL